MQECLIKLLKDSGHEFIGPKVGKLKCGEFGLGRIENSKNIVNTILDRLENINLLKDKKAILKKVHTLLKEGGEFYFSDVYSNRRLGEELKTNKLLHGECLGGALYVNDFITYAIQAGFVEPRLVSSKEIEILDPNIKELLGNVKFYSLTYRLWKIENLDSVCEDYGQSIIYKGGIEYCKAEFLLDANHLFEINRPEHVCKNTADMLMKTRYKKYFELQGNSNTHFGEFKACATLASMAKNEEKENGVVACC